MPRLRRLCLLVLAAAATLPGEDGFAIEAAGPELAPDGALVARQGFVLRLGDSRLVGDAVRWHQAQDELFAQGRIVYTEAGIRIAASRIGLRPGARTGDAWEVDATLEIPGRPGPVAGESRRIRLRAAQVRLTAESLEFIDVEADGGHGGVAAVRAPRITAWLRPSPEDGRSGAARHLEGLTIAGPTTTLAGVPVLWLPWLYRDFLVDYPWNRFETGKTTRQGVYFRWWLGTALPPLAGWRTFVAGRVDANSRNGEGYGAVARWRHPAAGRGELSWLRYPEESVKGPDDDRSTTAVRDQQVLDVEHRVGGSLGPTSAWAASARWLSVPDREDRLPGVPEEQPGLRFRSDYLSDDVEHRPYGRRGVAFAAATPLLAITADTRWRVSDEDPATERWAALGLDLIPLRLAGPIHAVGGAEMAVLRRRLDDDQALRSRWRSGVAAGDWLGATGLAWDAELGAEGLRYDDGELAGSEVEDEGRGVPVGRAGLRWRLVGRDGTRSLVVVPRIGVDLRGEGIGDGLAAWRFDSEDALEEDRRWLVTGVVTRLADSKTGIGFRAGIEARWALRDWDRRYADDDTRFGPDPLAEVVMDLSGRPLRDLETDITATWDGRPRTWTEVDGDARWWIHPRTALTWSTVVIPDAQPRDRWRQEPGVVLVGNRYTAIATATFQDGGQAIDRWSGELIRRMVEGELNAGIELVRAYDTQREDLRLTVGFTIGGGQTGPDEDAPAGQP